MAYALYFVATGKVAQIADAIFDVSETLAWTEITEGQEPEVGGTYNAETDTFNPAPERLKVYAPDPRGVLLATLAEFVAGTATEEDVASAYSEAETAINTWLVEVN